MSDNYAEETQPLFKLLRTEAFRFVIVRYNHFSFVQQLEKDLKRLFPKRPIKKVDAQKLDYTNITNAYFALKTGFFFINNFDDVLKEERDSLGIETPQYAKQNERRRGITAGLNLRRDKLAKSPIALFVFVPASTGELYAKTIMEKMPDLWSFRSFILDLEKEISIEKNILQNSPLKIGGDFRIGDDNIVIIDPSQRTELKRLISLLNKTPKSEKAYRLTLYPQIVDVAMKAGNYTQALKTLDEWEMQDNNKGLIWIEKGDVYMTIGNLNKALKLFESAKVFFEKNKYKTNLAVSFERLGETHRVLGDLDKTLFFYEEYNRLEKELYDSNPNNAAFKNSLAVSFERLGTTHMALGNLGKTMFFYEEYYRLEKELYELNPNDKAFKNGLAISYSKLGRANTVLGNLDKALMLYEEHNRLEKELYYTNSNNVEFKNGLAISYQYLGIAHMDLGNMDKALVAFEESNRLAKELYVIYPNNIFFKNGLAISYQFLGNTNTELGNINQALEFYEKDIELSKELYLSNENNLEFKRNLSVTHQFLGNTHTKLGNLDKALALFEEYNRLEKELYAAYPNNVDYKNGLAVSYHKLGEYYRDHTNDATKALINFKECEKLLKVLADMSPDNVEFQKNLEEVQQDIAKL
jgi:tetratricopeptide (TPR) repeat protein